MFQRKRREDPRIELTPMVDVVFLLLIFFMISTTFVQTPGIDVKLPESSAQTAERDPEEIKVHLSARGDIYFGEERLAWEAAETRLAGYATRAKEMTFLLMADRETQHGDVVRLMDLARSAGFGKLAIATEEKR
ncbi:MAG: biopolymer transporter ExbD [Desulfuromonadales bacterium]|jgi:biopolymer transport protein ExbD/biopolymer transport protein TolR